jgi:hypothetical protein
VGAAFQPLPYRFERKNVSIKRSLVGGVSYDEYYNKDMKESTDKHENAGSKGVPMGSFVREDVVSLTECQGVTKSGNACKARPVGGQMICAGHFKQQESRSK